MSLIPTLLLAILSVIPNCGIDEQPFTQTFITHGREYEVRFLDGGTNLAWPEDLVMRWRIPKEKKWHVVSRIEGVRLEKEVTLPSPKGSDIDALIVSAPGGSAQFISVVEISKNPPKLTILLDRALDKGGFDYRYDSADRLIGFKFKYWAWHVSPGELQGHAFTAVNIGWITKERKFRTGSVYIDDEREESASLTEILTYIVSDEVEATPSNDYKTWTYMYKPTGLLWRKTPSELRTAKKVKVVVKHGNSPEPKPYISEISAVDAD